MEHLNYTAFMIQCNSCSRGWSLSEGDLKNEVITCQDPECGSKFTIYEGIKNGLKKVEDHITPNFFLANDMLNQLVDVKIGFTTYVSFPEELQKVYKILLFPTGSFLAGATEITSKGFTLFSSLANLSDKSLIGEEGKVMVMASFKSSDYETPWLHMLQYAFEQLRAEEYLTSILLSEIAFETYIDYTLTSGYAEVGLDDDSIYRLLIATDIPVKVNSLMNNLYGIKLASSKSWRDWEKKVLKWRNHIAHGTKITATKEEAVLAYENIVDSIFYFIEGIDKYLMSKGHNQGAFF